MPLAAVGSKSKPKLSSFQLQSTAYQRPIGGWLRSRLELRESWAFEEQLMGPATPFDDHRCFNGPIVIHASRKIYP